MDIAAVSWYNSRRAVVMRFMTRQIRKLRLPLAQ